MTIQVTCSKCRRNFGASDWAAGKKAKCPECGNPIDIPLESSEPAQIVEKVDKATGVKSVALRQTPVSLRVATLVVLISLVTRLFFDLLLWAASTSGAWSADNIGILRGLQLFSIFLTLVPLILFFAVLFLKQR